MLVVGEAIALIVADGLVGEAITMIVADVGGWRGNILIDAGWFLQGKICLLLHAMDSYSWFACLFILLFCTDGDLYSIFVDLEGC